jgi:hypothetical protein
MSRDDDLISHIQRVLDKFPAVSKSWFSGSIGIGGFRDTVGYHALRAESIAVMNHVYGAEHLQAREFRLTISSETLQHLMSAEGLLRGSIESIRYGLLSDIRSEILLDVQSDFISAAQAALEGGAKDVAAALAAVVLEDSVKRLAQKHSLGELVDEEFSVVVTGLYKSSVVTKATKGALMGYKDLRNAALHAQWHEVSADAVRGLPSFLPGFIAQHGV